SNAIDMGKNLSFKKNTLSIMVLLLLCFKSSSQLTLKSFKDSTGKYGYKDKYWKAIIIPAKYQNADYFREGLAPVKLNGKWGFIDKTGKEVIPLRYQDVVDFHEGFAAVKADNKWGFIDKTGKEITSIKYEGVSSHFQEGFAGVILDNKWGCIEKTG